MGKAHSGITEPGLKRAVDLAAETGSAQLVIACAGEVMADEVFAADPVDVYAVQKALVSAMVGVAEHLGQLGLDDPVSDYLGAGWTHLSRATEERLTIRAVLDMTTGVDAELRPLGEVGSSWRYDNVSYNYLKTVLELVAGRSLGQLSHEWLFDPLGMTSTGWVERSVLRPDGRPITGLESTARDLARFGAMIAAGGDGVVPSAYVESLGRPGSAENPAWGLCWWNNNQSHHRLPRRETELREGPVTPEAPAGMIAARGAMENYLFVVPSARLVVARTAKPAAERPTRFDGLFWQALALGG